MAFIVESVRRSCGGRWLRLRFISLHESLVTCDLRGQRTGLAVFVTRERVDGTAEALHRFTLVRGQLLRTVTMSPGSTIDVLTCLLNVANSAIVSREWRHQTQIHHRPARNRLLSSFDQVFFLKSSA